VYAGFGWLNLRERGHSEDPGVDVRVMLNWIFKKWGGTWTELIWIRTGTSGGHL